MGSGWRRFGQHIVSFGLQMLWIHLWDSLLILCLLYYIPAPFPPLFFICGQDVKLPRLCIVSFWFGVGLVGICKSRYVL